MAATKVRIECIDCGGDGIEKMPCDRYDTRCEFCDGSGEVEVSEERFAELKARWPRLRKVG